MADGTKIEWTDATWNIVTGCSVVSPGCTNCYAMKLAGTRLRNHPSRQGLTIDTKAGPVWSGEVRFNRDWLDQPLRWKAPRMIFVAAHGDLFADGMTDEQLDQIFAVMALCPQHIFQVLTKRPERMRAYLSNFDVARRVYHLACDFALDMMLDVVLIAEPWQEEIAPAGNRVRLWPWPLPNVWLGVSVEDQSRANERIPILLDTPAAIRWISAEPMLGKIDLKQLSQPNDGFGPYWIDALAAGRVGWFRDEAATVPTEADDLAFSPHPSLDWVVAGGESGPHARPMHLDWPRQLRDQCNEADLPFLFKQWGNWEVACEANGHLDHNMARNDAHWIDSDGTRHKPSSNGLTKPYAMRRVTKAKAGRLLDGIEHNGFPTLPDHFKEID